MRGLRTAETPEQFVEQLRGTLMASRQSPAGLASASGLAENTVRNVLDGQGFPRRGTVERLIRDGCQLDERPWLDAWDRVGGQRRPLGRPAGHAELLAQVDELTRRNEELAAELASLKTAAAAGDAEQRALEAAGRAERALRQLHATLPLRNFTRHYQYSGDGWEGYLDDDVDEVLDAVGRLDDEQSVHELVYWLRRTRWIRHRRAGGSSALAGAEGESVFYDAPQVDAYLETLQARISTYLDQL